MFKVIIADDEERVCKLIMKLVDWEKLDMEVVGVAHNGIEAIQIIEEHGPDIVITDIRMPGYDGLEMIEKAKDFKEDLEFIIISGYGQFEYAQRAIKYGVKDYLLKPIQKNELMETLIKLGEGLKNTRGQLSMRELNEIRDRTDKEKRRSRFMEGLFNEENFKGLISAEKIRETYAMTLGEGTFQVLCLKVDTTEKLSGEREDIIEEKVRQQIEGLFCDLNLLESEVYVEDSLVLVLLHYTHGQDEEYGRRYRDLLQGIKAQNLFLKETKITLGQGMPVDQIKELRLSYDTALLAIEDRLLKGAGKVIKRDQVDLGNFMMEQAVYDFFHRFARTLSILDTEGVSQNLKEMKNLIRASSEVTGHEVIKLVRDIGQHYSFNMMKNEFPVLESGALTEEVESAIRGASSLEELFETLEALILGSLDGIISEKKDSQSRPIRKARQYMEMNYMKALTLDEVSGEIGFSASYFSSLFKKETGSSFIEYLSMVRMEKAKELIKDRDLRIADICDMVGYSDVKYFTKSFIKHTGLKPNEFRKIYA